MGRQNRGRRQKIKDVAPLVWTGLAIQLLYVVYRLVDTDPATTVLKYMIVFAGVFVVLAVFYLKNRSLVFSPLLPATVLLFALVFQLTLLTARPHMSDDIYRYVWDGKLQYHGVNPYAYAPDDPVLAPLHSPMLPGLVNFPHIKTIYPPCAQITFLAPYGLFGESVTGMKAIFSGFFLATVVIFYLLLEGGHRGAAWLPLFAWNPLPIMETAINGHLDTIMVFFLLWTLYLFKRRRFGWAGATLALATAAKLIPLVLLPLLLLHLYKKEAGAPAALRFLGVWSATLALSYVPYLASAHNMFLTALNYSSKWYFNNPFFTLLLALVKDNATAHLVSFSIFIALYPLFLLSRGSLEDKIVYILVAFVLCNPTIHPWYLILLLGLLAIRPGPTIFLWSGLVVVAYGVVYHYKVSGTWQDSPLLMALEYLPLAILLAHRFMAANKSGGSQISARGD